MDIVYCIFKGGMTNKITFYLPSPLFFMLECLTSFVPFWV